MQGPLGAQRLQKGSPQWCPVVQAQEVREQTSYSLVPNPGPFMGLSVSAFLRILPPGRALVWEASNPVPSRQAFSQAVSFYGSPEF